MSEEKTFDSQQGPTRADDAQAGSEDEELKVSDRRHWQQDDGEEAEPGPVEPARPSILDEYNRRAEEAEAKLQEYIEAFKRHQADHEQVRERLTRDVERKVELKFGELLGDLLSMLDDLDLSLSHVRGVPGAEPLAEGVVMARDRFLNALQKHGVERFSPDGEPFDPNESEALRVDPVETAEDDQVVTETLKPGYKLGQRVIRAAQVAVGRHDA
jgi:molecular chaperone GrpE